MDAIAFIELAINISATTNNTLAEVQSIIEHLDAQNFEEEVARQLEIAEMQLAEARFLVDTVYPSLQQNFTIAADLVELGSNNTARIASQLILLRHRVHGLRIAAMYFNGSSASLLPDIASVMMAQDNVTAKATQLIDDVAASQELLEETQLVMLASWT